jgi:uncharacterized protein
VDVFVEKYIFVKSCMMRKIFIFSFLFILNVQFANAQNTWKEEDVKAFQEEMNLTFADSLKSPLRKKSREKFKGLDFFDINPNMVVNAKLIRTKKSKPFQMPTTTGRRPTYKKYGELHFELLGVKCQLEVYQNLDLIKMEKYKNHLFLPFTDLTSGEESYGGGRYLDIEIPQGKEILLDFNRAYNPYCAYNEDYSCPLVPQVNDLNVAVKAGVKNYQKP